MDTGTLASMYDFENREATFPGVHRSYKFCLLTMAGPRAPVAHAEFSFFALRVEDLQDEERRFTLSADNIALLNPNTRTAPIFRIRRDAELTKAIYRRVPVLVREAGEAGPEVNPWGIRFKTMFHMANDSHPFRTRAQLEAEGWVLHGNVFRPDGDDERYLPLYEGKMVHQFDHRWATYDWDNDSRDLTVQEKQDAGFLPVPRYWVRARGVVEQTGHSARRWFLGFRDIARTTDERTAIFGIIPYAAVGNRVPLLGGDSLNPPLALGFIACCTSLAFDFVARQKLGGTTMNFFYVRQFPVLPPKAFQAECAWDGAVAISEWIAPRVLELTYTAWDLQPFAHDCGYNGPPLRWDPERRFLLRCELDAAFFHLYGIACDDVAYIMDTFPIVRRKDEAEHGEYRTKRVIFEVYDDMAQAIANGRPYRTRLDPPPADPRVAHRAP